MANDVTLNAGAGGAIIATDATTSSEHHQLVKPVYGDTGTFNMVSTNKPLPVATASSGATQVVGTVTVVSASSGLVQISGTATVVSASSGLVQISGTPTVAISSSAIAPVNIVTSSGAYVPVTTSAGLLVQATGPISVSGTVTVLSASSGLVQISGTPTVTATAATNPWSSAPSFNVPIVSASSGLVQISGTPTVLSASSGFVQVYQTTTPWSILSASSGLIQALGNVTTSTPEYSAGINLLTLTTAGALRVATSASASGSTEVNVVGSTGQQVVVTSSGAMLVSATVVASTATQQFNIVGTSSAVAPATSSGGLLVTAIASTVWTVTATAATNPWSSAPGFNVPIVSASSGLIQISGTVTIVSASSGLIQILPQSSAATLVFSYVSSSSNNSNNVQSGNTAFFGYAVFNTTGTQRYVKIYNTSSAPTVGTTANFLMTLGIPGSTAGGAGANLVNPTPLAFSTRGLSFTITSQPATTDTGTIGNNDLVVNLFYV